MRPRRLLYLDAHALSACSWESGTLLAEGRFANAPDGLSEFGAYLERHPKSVFYLLANVSGEGFQLETIPFLRGADRKAVVDRKLGQLFHGTALATAVSLGHQQTRRKDERILFVALTNQSCFTPWLAVVKQKQAILGGIHSLPLLSAPLLRRLKLPSERCLLLSVQDRSIRQSYFEQGELHFSRLTQLHDSSLSGIARAFATEAGKTYQYLASQRGIERSPAMPVYILAHPLALPALNDACSDSEALNFQAIDLESAARQLGLLTTLSDSRAEMLFMHLLASSTPKSQFADDDLRHAYRLWQLRSGLLGAGALVLIGCLLFAGKEFHETYRLDTQAEQTRREAAAAQQRYRDIAGAFPPLPTDHETLRRAVTRFVAIERQSGSPTSLYQEISRALQATPQIDIDDIEWSFAADQNPAAPRESARVKGRLHAGGNHPRQLLNAFKLFVDGLKANPELAIKITQPPFGGESKTAFTAGDAGGDDDAPRQFAIQVERKGSV